MKKLKTCLWFDDQAEEAVRFYTSVFKNSKITGTSHYGEEGHEIHGREAGTVLTVEFEINGQPFMALNGGPQFTFNEAISLIIDCENQEEIDYYWDKLSDDPEAEQCGWCKDQYGVSWQVIPTVLGEMLDESVSEASERVMKAMLEMKKINIEKLKQAYHSNS